MGQFIVYWQFSTSRKRQSVQSAKCSKCCPKKRLPQTPPFCPPKRVVKHEKNIKKIAAWYDFGDFNMLF